MSLNNTYFETKGRDITNPIPESPGYIPPDVPTPETPEPGSVPSINRPTFTGNVTYILYNSPCEKRMIHKEQYLSEIESGTLSIKEDCSLTEPVIYINTSNDLTEVNYMRLGRFYYYVRCELLPGGDMYRIVGKRDALTSFKNDILYLKCIVDKNEFQADPYIDDGSYVVDERENIEVLNYPLGFNDAGTYILITAGG